MAVTTTKEFLAVCRKSGLLDDDQLTEAEQWTKKTDDPKRMAATMAARRWVTRVRATSSLFSNPISMAPNTNRVSSTMSFSNIWRPPSPKYFF